MASLTMDNPDPAKPSFGSTEPNLRNSERALVKNGKLLTATNY